MNNETYWFARGYYDGRNAGVVMTPCVIC